MAMVIGQKIGSRSGVNINLNRRVLEEKDRKLLKEGKPETRVAREHVASFGTLVKCHLQRDY
jgi:hypothetical protein